ncbi:F-box LRR-repeat 13-like, partial [Paramuricea clavata]
MGSGGGYRAACGLSGVMVALQESGILDCATYVTGLSGSSWYISSLYIREGWPDSITCEEMANDLKKRFDTSLFSHFQYDFKRRMDEKAKGGQPVRFTDFFGMAIGDALLPNQNCKLSFQDGKIRHGEVPLPITTAIRVRKDIPAGAFNEWVEFTPYEFGTAKYGVFGNITDFGGKYYKGQLVKRYQESPLHYLQGIWGSAFSIILATLNSGQKKTEGQRQEEIACAMLKDAEKCKTEEHDSEDEETPEDEVDCTLSKVTLGLGEISAKIRKVVRLSLLRMVFVGWRTVVVDSKKTREYFERIERGEVIDTGDYKDFFETAEDGKDVISSLPKHVALLIFSNVDIQDLGRCASVSRSWKLIIQSSLLWSKMDFTRMKYKLTNKITSRLVHRYRSVLGHLNLRGCCNLSQGSLKIIGESKNLQDLNVSECVGIDDDVVKSIAAGCSSLLYLNLSRCKISDATLRSLARNCVNLQYLSLSGCAGFSDKGLSYIAHGKGARKLSFLDLSGCDQVTEHGFMTISIGFLSISTLILNDLPSLRDDHLKMLTDKCNSVKTISILNSPLISDAGMKYLTKFRRLQKIQIEANNRITDSAVKAIAKSCPELRHVFIADCPRLTDLSLKALASCKYLIVLNIADCVRIQDAGVRQVVEGPSGARLREINLTNCVRVSDVTLLRIAQRCHNLTYCSVCYCEHVTDAGLELLATLPSLVSLDISGCNIQDHGLSSLGNSSRLRDITLSGCRAVTDLGLQKMFQQCRYLENLDLSYCE